MLGPYIGDVRTLRRRLESEVRELGGAVAPATYEVRWPDVGLLQTGVASIRLDAARGPFVLCGLFSSRADKSPGAASATTALVDIIADGRKMTSRAPVLARDVFTTETGVEVDWPRPIIAENILALDATVTGADRIDGGVTLLGGFHTSAKAAAALRKRGELWAASVLAATTAGAPNGRAEVIFDRDVFATSLLSSEAAGSGAVVDALTVQVGDVNLTPLPLRGLGVFARSTMEPQSTLNIACPRGSRFMTRIDYVGTRSAYLTLLGATVWG